MTWLKRQKARKPIGSNYPGLALAKGLSRAAEKRADDAEQSAVVQAVRADLFARKIGCEVCGDSERMSLINTWPGEHQMNEIVSRAKTRGLPPAVRFSFENCCRVCARCHEKITRNIIHVWRDVDGMLQQAPGAMPKWKSARMLSALRVTAGRPSSWGRCACGRVFGHRGTCFFTSEVEKR